MHSRTFTTALAGLLVLAAPAACSGDDDAGPAPTTAVETSEVSVETGDRGWAQFGHDLANSRLSPDESRIGPDTVADLVEVWAVDDLVGVTSSPTLADGVAHFGDWTGVVHAVEAGSGTPRWTTELGGSVIGSTPVADDAVFASSGTTLHRLDRRTGEVEWETRVDEHPFAMISASPVVAGEVVLQGVASGEVTVPQDDYTFTGSLSAFDAATGERLWRLDTTPGDDSAGAGVGIWSTPAVDLATGTAFVGTGNTYEEPSAPLADSLLAVDLATGELLWSRAFTAPDVFSAGSPTGPDADVGAAPMLWAVDGRALVGVGDKAGVFHALDRATGDVVWEATLTPGSTFGGVNGSSALAGGTIVVASNVGDPETNAPRNTVDVIGLDPATGAERWRTDLDGMVFAPVSATPDLAFVATTLGELVALTVADGQVRWQRMAPAPVGGGATIQDGLVLWGHGYALFEGPGDGGLTAYGLDP